MTATNAFYFTHSVKKLSQLKILPSVAKYDGKSILTNDFEEKQKRRKCCVLSF